MPTVYDVARLAGVSTATVSRVMRGSDLVRLDTRERVLAVIDEVGFVPDASAQGLSRRRKEIIGLVALERAVDETDIERDGLLFVDQLVHAVEAVLRGTECSLLLSFGPSGEHFQQRIRALSGKVDGLLVVEDVMPAAQLRALARRLPVVAVAASPGEAGLDAVRVDNSGGMRALAEHLLTGHGYCRLGFAAGPPDAPDAVERLTAFSSAVHDQLALTVNVVPGGDFSEASGRTAARMLLSREAVPEAVACANDQMAIGVIRELQRVGYPGTRGRRGDRIRRHLPGPGHRPGAHHGEPAVPGTRRPRRRAPDSADRGQRGGAARRRSAHRAGHPA